MGGRDRDRDCSPGILFRPTGSCRHFSMEKSGMEQAWNPGECSRSYNLLRCTLSQQQYDFRANSSR